MYKDCTRCEEDEDTRWGAPKNSSSYLCSFSINIKLFKNKKLIFPKEDFRVSVPLLLHIFGTVNLETAKVYFGSCFGSFPSLTSWPCCFCTCGGMSHRSVRHNKTAIIMSVTWKTREGRSQDPQSPSKAIIQLCLAPTTSNRFCYLPIGRGWTPGKPLARGILKVLATADSGAKWKFTKAFWKMLVTLT